MEAARRSCAAALVTATSRVPATAARNSLSGKAEKGSVFGFVYNKIAMNSSIKERPSHDLLCVDGDWLYNILRSAPHTKSRRVFILRS